MEVSENIINIIIMTSFPVVVVEGRGCRWLMMLWNWGFVVAFAEL